MQPAVTAAALPWHLCCKLQEDTDCAHDLGPNRLCCCSSFKFPAPHPFQNPSQLWGCSGTTQ